MSEPLHAPPLVECVINECSAVLAELGAVPVATRDRVTRLVRERIVQKLNTGWPYEAQFRESAPAWRAHESAALSAADTPLPGPRPRIVCLCGSTRFYAEFQAANYRETMAGRVVLSVGFYAHSAEQAHGEAIGCTPAQKVALDGLHLRKIDLADEVLVINVGGYVGESTAREIAYAHWKGVPVRYLEPAPDSPAGALGDSEEAFLSAVEQGGGGQ